MPIYEYECEQCHEPAELLIRGEETPTCPKCGSTEMAKQLSVPAAHSGGGGGLDMLPPGGGCGRPQCGQGGCQGLG